MWKNMKTVKVKGHLTLELSELHILRVFPTDPQSLFFSTVHIFDTLKHTKHSKASEKRLTVPNFLD